MNPSISALKSIAIVGGGTAGWISASVLAHLLQNTECHITLVESPDVPTIGVGEATIPSFVDLLRFLTISEVDFIAKTNATFKLGIQFINWKKIGHSYWHPFGMIGSKIDGKDFYQHWLKSHRHGDQWKYTDFSPSIALAQQNRFFIPDPARPGNLSKSAYALHFDAGLAAHYFSHYAQKKNVNHRYANVKHAVHFEDGRIQRLLLDNGEYLDSDFFIDCTGQKALLIGEAMQIPYEDWSHYLPVNRAAVVQSNKSLDIPPYTQAVAHEHGWRWKIPLQNRTGNGYVFSSEHCSDDEAITLLLDNIDTAPIATPRIINFRTGKRKVFWHKNCLAVGLSSGFLEPLESTSIYLAMKAILNFSQMLPNNQIEQVTIDEFNRLMDVEYECIRDFILLHYCVTQRTDSAFWRNWQSCPIPTSLQQKISLFLSQGRIQKNSLDLFSAESWYSVLEGMGMQPRDYDHSVDATHFEKTRQILHQSLVALRNSAAATPLHSDFINILLSRAVNSGIDQT
jgi:tryptophan 7-halogenase